MVKVTEMPIRQEKTLSSDFHMEMLRQLEEHHLEHSRDWSYQSAVIAMSEAIERIYRAMNDPRQTKQLVHAANYLTIAWAIRSRHDGLQASEHSEGRAVGL